MQATLPMPSAAELLPLIPELVLVGAAFALLMLLFWKVLLALLLRLHLIVLVL